MADRVVSPPVEPPTEVAGEEAQATPTESTYVAAPTATVGAPEGLVMVKAEDIHVKYRVY